ncbi:MAG: hypothetical protein GY934_15675, partial [Gammaproteobacteria bacterium]|nr:hypothetical protein [Gammaproteobacteria bacterium]
MKNEKTNIYIGSTQTQAEPLPVEGDYIQLLGETYYRIGHYDQIPPFFISLVSSADHWLFISSTGGLTAGRINAESALFPYETDDKIAAHSEDTGSKTIFLVTRSKRAQLWEPFSVRYAGLYRCERNIYKNIYGNKLLFEEINHDLQLTYRYAWRTGDRFGFIKSSWLYNNSADACQITLIDGLQNLLPYGATTQLQSSFSNLLKAYKHNEIEPSTGLGIFALSATLTDRAEPSESLKATVAWQVGLDPVQHLLCTDQIDKFRYGLPLTAEQDITGKAGAYLVNSTLTLAAEQLRQWHIVADVNQDSRDVVNLVQLLQNGGELLVNQLEKDIERGTVELVKYVASADGLQVSADEATTSHHFANVLFNIMRGGILADDYQVDKRDLLAFVRTRNHPLLATQATWFEALPDKIDIRELYAQAATANSADLERLCYEYLPLIFSRRYGDPSRPWNRFSINLKQPDGSPRLDYQRNWRDIFQNWEPLAYAFPAYIEGMIARFLNATTADGYQVDKRDLLAFVHTRNHPVLATQAMWFEALPDKINIRELYAQAATANSADLERLCYEYLPLIFSRRHGDPSRPWNRFSINLKQPDGSPRLDYQGNWRDIFQNWEPLAYAFPAYIEGMIARFLNATTTDGYNPYRVTRDGIEWEVPEPDNPWSNIGYWSDHQIIYLQKLLEFAEQVHPGTLATLWNRPIFSYANVPYRLRPYQDMLVDWYNTIDFDWDSERDTEAAVGAMGTDGRLCRDSNGAVIHVTMVEKLLVLLLAKLTNLVPEGGIWMNTQRPEWNDANNALVGKGLSVVTTAYLHRFIEFWQAQLADAADTTFSVNVAVADLFEVVQAILASSQSHLENGFTAKDRRAVMDALGVAVSEYRSSIYRDGLPVEQAEVTGPELQDFLALAQAHIEHTLRANRRPDNLYHTYNILRMDAHSAAVAHLYPMLEGQVAILSSGILRPDEALALLQSLRQSSLYRPDQHSYILYPNRVLPGFLEKNNITTDQVVDSALVAALTAAGDQRLIILDNTGKYHFNGTFRNADDVGRVLTMLAQESAYAELVAVEQTFVLDLFETVFNHRLFTGRSGTFYAFEGLGSIYWHMVSKLLLAAQECHTAATISGAEPDVTAALATTYYDIRQGLGFNKSPEVYGAFPPDPYSHTPAGSGARQPGMTGQVKEEILTRLGELGVTVKQGELHFNPTLLRPDDFLHESGHFNYIDVQGNWQTRSLPANSLGFTLCQT